MVYAKQLRDGMVVSLNTYDYQPNFTEDSHMVIITKEEYDELSAAFKAEAAEKQAENTDE